MAERQRTDEGIQQGGMGKAVKRRGILAAAGAVVAGIVAKQTSQPVGATIADGDVVLGASNNAAPAMTAVINNASAVNSGPALVGVRAAEFMSAIRVGDAAFWGETHFTDADGVYGEALNGGYAKGVHGVAGSGYGVYGEAVGSGGYGVTGIAPNLFGVLGQSDRGTAVQGQVNSTLTGGGANTAANTIAVRGTNAATGSGGIGVQGVVNAGSAGGTIAISGSNQSSAPDSHGIVGVAGSGHGLIGNTNFAGAGPPYYAGLVGNAPNGAYAGLFFGKVSITGTLNGHTAIIQHAQVAVAHPDGTHRLVNSVNAVESWLEDFGKGTLTNGQVEVKIDPAFAALADLGDYHVFLTEHGDYHLHVAEMKADGFVVRVSSAGGGTQPTGGGAVGVSQVAKAGSGTGTFSWRMAAKRKDGQAARLAIYTFPKLEAPHIPEPPKAAETKTKP